MYVFHRLMRIGLVLAMAGTGCGNRTGVPQNSVVELPDGTTTTVTLGSGVPSLADSTWNFFVTGSLDDQAAQSLPLLTITFGPRGELTRFDDNPIAPDLFGHTIHFDGENHATSQPGLSYSAGTYGAETADASGFSFVGRLTAFAAGFTAANATVTASGVFDTNDPTAMTGTLEFSIRATVDFIPNANMDEGYTLVAHRVAD